MITSERTYVDLKNEIWRLTIRRDDLIAIAANERVWQGHAYVHGKPAEDVASVYDSAVLRVNEQIGKLEAQLPCIEFAHQFGWLLYGLYQEKHPINRETKLINWKIKDAQVVYYPLFEQMSIYAFNSGDLPPIRVDKNGSAPFERWATADFRVNLKLAYAPETNTVYWIRL